MDTPSLFWKKFNKAEKELNAGETFRWPFGE